MDGGLWLLPTAAATICWAFSDICSDYCIEQDGGAEARKARCSSLKIDLLSRRRQLCGEQKAFLSGATTFLFGCLGVCGMRFDSLHTVSIPPLVTFLALFSGALHFISYYYTLKAYNSAPSTIVTPLLQLSAVFMLPLSIVAAHFGISDRPVISWIHLQAVVFISVGGFLPLAEGDFSRFVKPQFWRNPVLRHCAIAEVLVCIYNLLLHYLTYKTEHEQAVFSLSIFGNGLACVVLFLTGPKVDHVASLVKDVDPRCIAVAIFGECTSLVGLWLGNMSYAIFYEPAVINAAEGGLQQMFNLILAMFVFRCMPRGRKVTDVPTKVFSLCAVAFGLYLSTL